MKKIIFLLALTACFFGSCRSVKPVYLTEYRDSIVYKNRLDSIYIHKTDSVRIFAKGDTIFHDRWRTLYKDRFLTDTLQVTVEIDKPYPVEVPVPVEKKLNWWQRITGAVGTFTLAALLIFIFGLIRKYLKP